MTYPAHAPDAASLRAAPARAGRWPVAAFLLAAVALPGLVSNARATEGGPSFDCKAARSAPEKMICADPALAALDRRIAAAYRNAMAGLDPKARIALRDDQRFFLQARDAQLDEKDPDYDFKADLASRASLLEGIDVAPRPGWPGTWANTIGEITLSPSKGGTFAVHISTVQPNRGYPVCDFSAIGRTSGAALVVGGSKAERAENDGWTAKLTRKGVVLSVELVAPKGDNPGSPPFCGFRGSADGDYMPAKPQAHEAPAPKP